MAISDVKRVNQYEVFVDCCIKKNDKFERIYEITKNLCYSLSYIEYLTDKIRNEENFVIKSQLHKTYIITGMSIVECILHYVIKTNNLNNKIEYREISKHKSNSKKLLGEEIKIETIISQKLTIPIEEEMNLDKMIKIAEKHKLLGAEENQTYARLNRLRKLRNKVHLHISDILDHDFNSFTMREALIMKEILKVIIYSNLFIEFKDKNVLFNYMNN
jgi:hypothetical protein